MSITFSTSNKVAEPVNFQQYTFEHHITKTKEYKKAGCGEILNSSAPKSTLALDTRNLNSNGLVGCLVNAYNHHHNVVLRPEDFWIAILTQFSAYVNANAEKLRNTFVDFQGKRELTVYIAAMDIRNAPYNVFATEMTKRIAENLKDASVREWILPQFTTTTPNDTVVCSIAMMASLQQYFSYRCCLLCGIPNVTLLGTPDDYLLLLKKVDQLAQFPELKQWHALLRPIFVELHNASNGKHNVDFWSKVCSHHGGGSGPTYLSGWVTAFCCFDEKGRWQGNRTKIDTWQGSITSAYPLIDFDDVPSGLVSVPVTVDDAGTLYDTRMIAGSFLLDKVDAKTMAPRLDWCMALVDKSKITNIVNEDYDDDF